MCDRPGLSGISRFLLEFLYFGLFFAAVFLVPRSGLWGIPRYDALLAIALAIQAWRLFELRVVHHLLLHASFHRRLRWYIAACALGLYARTTVIFRPLDRDRRMPLLLAFILIGFFILLAENNGVPGRCWSS